MALFISDLADTIIPSFNLAILTFGDWTLIPKKGLFKQFLEQRPRIKSWISSSQIVSGVGNDRLDSPGEEGIRVDDAPPTLENIARDEALHEEDLVQKLAWFIRRTAHEVRNDPPIKYSYEEWVEFTRLIRFTWRESEEEDGLVEWDWIGEDSPILSGQSEAEWILDRLCESMSRYSKMQRRLQNERATSLRNAVTSIKGS
jgi:potassium channel subfamily K